MASGAQTSNKMDEMSRPLHLTVHWPLLVPELCLSQGAEKHASQVPGSIYTVSGNAKDQESPAHCFVFPPFLASR